jgi:hypothetical protein
MILLFLTGMLFTGMAFAQAANPEPLIRADWLQFRASFGVMEGRTGTVGWPNGGTVSEYFEVSVLQYPECFSDSSYICTLRWEGPSTTPMDSSAWPRLWPGAAWRIDTSTAPIVSGNCQGLDPARFGDDPIAMIAGSGWYLGYGPITRTVALGCGSGDTRATIYIWMEGAAPMPVGDVEVNALDENGDTTNDGVPGAASASALPDGWFDPRCSFYSPS